MTTDEIVITIDGVEVRTQPGKMIIQAAMDAGMYIPYLCYYPGMKPYGACRMCVVEAESRTPDGEYRALPGSPASCTTPVADGMRVRTNTDRIIDLRKGIMELVISEHPHGCLTCHRVDLCGPSDICLRHVSVNDRCLTCPKNERCELKDTVRYLEMEMDTPLTYNNRNIPQKVNDPMWDMDMNLCIVCVRCVRVCDEVRGDSALTLIDRSGRTLIGTSQGTSLLESGCEFCGACIDICPTGALVERDYKWEKAVETVTTICPQCPVGCQVELEINKRNRMIRVIPDRHAAANQGQACFKGKFGLDFVNRRDQLKQPMIKRNGELEPVMWHDALDFLTERLPQYKGDQFALIASPRGTNEDNYIAQKFTRSVMQSNNVDISSNIRPELTEALGDVLGHYAATNPIWELEQSACFLVVSSNMTEEQNVAAVPIKKAVNTGASLIVIDQRETELTRFAKVWLRPNPGTESTLIGGMLRVIIDESLDDHDFLADNCDNVGDFRNNLWTFDLLRVERITGIPLADIQAAARLFTIRKPAAILYALETLSPEARDTCTRALINLALVTGSIGKPSSGLFPLFPGANEQGSKDVGCTPHYLPGYRAVANERARSRIESAWNATLPETPGLSLKQMIGAINDGRIKALQIIDDSPNFTNGELGDFLAAVKKLDFLVVHSAFENELTELADVVLPSATFAQKEGTFTNMERRVQLLRPALGLKGEEETEWKVICQIAERMGAQGFDYHDIAAIFDEINDLVQDYGGITIDRLQTGGLQWPCLAADMEDTPVMYAEGTEARKARLSDMALVEAVPHDNQDYPLILAQGRVLHQPEREIGIELLDARNQVKRDDIIEIHPEDAAELGVSDGEWVEAVTEEGRIRGVVRLTSPQKGLVSVTTLFGEMITKIETDGSPDPMLKTPRLPLVPVRIEKTAAQEVAAD